MTRGGHISRTPSLPGPQASHGDSPHTTLVATVPGGRTAIVFLRKKDTSLFWIARAKGGAGGLRVSGSSLSVVVMDAVESTNEQRSCTPDVSSKPGPQVSPATGEFQVAHGMDWMADDNMEAASSLLHMFAEESAAATSSSTLESGLGNQARDEAGHSNAPACSAEALCNELAG